MRSGFSIVVHSLGLLGLALVLSTPAIAHGPKKPETAPAAESVVETTAETAAEAEPVPTAWGCPMCESVRTDSAGKCPLCRMALVPMAASEAGGATPKLSDPAEHGSGHDPAGLMPGAPDGVFYGATISLLLLSFVLFELWGRRSVGKHAAGRRWDVLRIPGLRRLLARPGFLFALQFPVVLLFSFIIFAGLFGNSDPSRNIAPALTWTLWWTWLAFVILFLGKAWCTVCPWMAIADWIARLGKLRRSGKPFGLEKRWPRRLRNIWLATTLFIALTWLELGYGVTEKPWLTATLALAMVGASILTVLVFERRAFCRYACLVGRVSGLYSMFSASELRSRDKATCKSCESKACFNGTSDAAPCPTHQFIGSMTANTYCTLCMECVRSCPEDNISWNVRPPGADLVESTRTRVDEAYLAVTMLSMSAFHGLSMTPNWDRLVEWIGTTTGFGWLASFSIGMAATIILPIIVYYGICSTMKFFASDRKHSTRYLFIKFSYSLLPIALFYHVAHNLQHVFFEGKKLMRIASDPLGRGWDLFGTADMLVDAVLPIQVGWGIQVGLIVIGHVFGIFIAHKAAAALYDTPRKATMSQIPMLAAMMLFSFQSLWLIAQPMVMRTAM